MDINNLYKDIITELVNRFVLHMNKQGIFRVNDRSYNNDGWKILKAIKYMIQI